MLLAVIAEVIKLIIIGGGQSPPSPAPVRLQSGKLAQARQKPQHMTARNTFHVFEENETATAITLKCFHAVQDEGK